MPTLNTVIKQASRGADLYFVFRFLRLLTMKYERTDAYKYGIIDKNGKVLRKNKTLTIAKEKDAYTILHRFVFNLKRIINFIPGGKSKLGTYAAALGLLLKEGKEINMVELEKDLYKHLSENNLIKLDDVNESVGFDFLEEGKYIIID